jgi:hypothetical protein
VPGVSERLFTVEEVNDLIPRLQGILQRLQVRGDELRRAVRAAMEESGRDGSMPTAELLRTRPEVEAMAREIESLLADIEASGGQFKGLELGLIDFPAEIDGERVLLCWQYGETEVGFYHAVESGFAGRRPLPHSRPRLLQ